MESSYIASCGLWGGYLKMDSAMIQFSSVILQDIATFVATPPIYQLFGLICFCFVAKAVRVLIKF